MGLQARHQALKDGLTGNRLVLSKKTLGVRKIEEIFRQTFGRDDLEVTGVQSIDLSPHAVTFSGNIALYHIPDLHVSASVVEANGKEQIVLDADLLSNWNYSPAAPTYPPSVETVPALLDKAVLSTLFQQLANEKPRLVFSSYAHDNTDFGFQLEQGSHLLWTYAPDSGTPPVSLGGAVTREDGQLVCRVPLPYEMKLGANTLDQIEVFFDVPRAGGLGPTRYGIKGRLSVGTLKVNVQGIVDIYTLDVELWAESQSLAVNGFRVLAGLTGVSDLGGALSNDLKNLPGLKLTRVAVRFNPIQNKLLRASVTVKTTKAWRALAPHFTVENIVLDAAVENPLDAAARVIAGSVTGKMKLAGANLSVQALFPEPAVIGELEGGNVTLKKLLRDFAPSVTSVPALKVARLSVAAHPAHSRFMIGAGVEGDWSFDIGAVRLSVREAHCDVLSEAGTVSGALHGIFALAGCDFMMRAVFPDLAFTAEAIDQRAISLKALLMDLTAGAVTLPPSLPDLSVANLALACTPKAGEFSVAARGHLPWAVMLGGVAVSIGGIAWHLERKKAGGSFAWTAGLAGRFKLADADFGVQVEKYGSEDDAWRLSAALAQDKSFTLKDFLKAFLPSGAALPDDVATLSLKSARIAFDFKTSALAVEAETVAALSFAGLGSIEAHGLAFDMAPRAGTPSRTDWRLKLKGSMKMAQGFELAGSLDCFDDAQGAGVAFVPTAQTPLVIPLPVPKYKSKDIAVNLAFGAISIVEQSGKFTFESAVTVGFDNLPDFFDSLITDRSTASFKANEDGMTLTVDKIFEGIDIALPAIPVSSTQSIDLGKLRFDITDLRLEVGDEAAFSAKFGVGIPQKLNNVFGVKANGKPQLELFRTYDPRRPSETLTRSLLTAGTAGVSFTIVDSPLKAITLTESGGKIWCECDFGELGAVKFLVPVLSLDVASASFKGAGAMQITRPLQIPLALFKNLLSENGLQDAATLLPDAIPLTAIKLLDTNNNIDVNKLVAHLEKSTGGAVRLPREFKDVLASFGSVFNRLPDRLRGYFNISLPDAVDFDLAVTPDGGVTVNVSASGAPIKALVWNPPQPILFGVELRGFSFGEILSGQLFLLKADVTIDMFDMYSLAAALLPDVPFIADSRKVHYSWIVRKLTMLIFYQTSVPIPIPLFYDELGIEYHGIEDLSFQTHVEFPMPKLNPMEIVRVFGEFQRFVSDKNYLMDTSNPPRDADLKFILGANYIQLPKYLGSGLLGKRTDLATISLYESVAGLMNGMKTLSVNRLVRIVPIQHRVGAQEIAFLGMKFQSQWLVTTPQEFVDSAYRKLNLNAAARQDLLALVPKASSTAPSTVEGLVVFLQGSGAVAGAGNWAGKFALAAVDGAGCATGFRLAGSLLNGLIGMDLSGSVKMNAKSSSPFELAGAGELTFLNEKAMSAEIGYGPDGLTLKGSLDLFPTTSLLQVEASVAGALGPDSFLLEGDARFALGQHLVLSGARAKVTHTSFTVMGTWMGQSLDVGMMRQGAGVRFFAGMAPLVAAGNLLKITGPSALGGPSLTIDARAGAVPECIVAGTAALLGATGQTQLRLTAHGSTFHLTGKIFNLYHAALEVTTAVDLLKADAVHVTASLKPDFFAAAQAGVTAGLSDLSQQADARVKAEKAKLDKAKKELDAAIAKLESTTRQIENGLKAQETQARAQVSAAQATVTQVQRTLNDTTARVNADKRRAERALDDARDKVDGLQRDIDKVKKDLRKWRRQLRACKPWEVTKIATLTAKIADGELKKAGLDTAKGAATLALNTAKAAVQAAAAAATQAISSVNRDLGTAKRALDDAKKRLADIRKQLQQVSSDIRLQAFKAARATKEMLFNQAKRELDQSLQREKALLDVGGALARASSPANVFEVKSAGFSGFLNVVHGGVVSMTVAVRIMRGPTRTLSVPFDFANPASGMAAILTEVQRRL